MRRLPRQVCEVTTVLHAPIYVSPRRLSMLSQERAFSFGELRTELAPLGLGSCCGRQNTIASSAWRTGPGESIESGATFTTLSRGPWCPPSTFYMFHRGMLRRHLASLRLWAEAFAAKALTSAEKLIRWEYVSCALLAPGEAILLAYYNSTQSSAQGWK